MIKIYYTTYTAQWSAGQWNAYYAEVPVTLREDFLRYKRWQDRQSALSGKLLLKRALELNGYKGGALPELLYTYYKRPYLDLPVDFNISHSGSLVVCAVSDLGKVGVDIEEIKPVEFEHFDKIMSPSEWDTIKSAQDPLSCFYDFWSLKESVVKADGRGLSFPLEKLELGKNKARIEEKEWHIKKLSLDPAYASYIAFEEQQEITIEKMDF